MCNVIALTGKNIGEFCKIKSRKDEKCWLHRRKFIDVTLEENIFVDNTECEYESEDEFITPGQRKSKVIEDEEDIINDISIANILLSLSVKFYQK